MAEASFQSERFRLALEAGRMGTWEWDVGSGAVVWDEAMEARYGLAPGTFEGTFDAFLRLVHPLDIDAASERIHRSLDAGDDLHYEHRVIWPNGEVHWIEGRGRVMHGADGRPEGMVGVGIDIDRRKATEETLVLLRHYEDEQARTTIEVLQHALVPTEFPPLPGYEIAGRYVAADVGANVGGDWFDAFRLSTHELLVTIGDVSGHGVLAARTMAKMRHGARAFACENPDPESVLTRLAHFFERLALTDEIATVIVGVLDLADHTFTMASAGHPPVLVVRGDTATFVDGKVGPPFGVTDRAPARSRSTALEPGEMVVLYTDGVIESRTELLDRGMERLAHAARAHRTEPLFSVCDHILAECDAGHTDDACVLVIRRT